MRGGTRVRDAGPAPPGVGGRPLREYYQRSSQTYRDTYWYSTFDEYDRGAFNPGDDYSYGGDWGPDDDTGFVDS